MDKSFHRVWPNINIQRSYCFCGWEYPSPLLWRYIHKKEFAFFEIFDWRSNINISNSFVNDGLRSIGFFIFERVLSWRCNKYWFLSMIDCSSESEIHATLCKRHSVSLTLALVRLQKQPCDAYENEAEYYCAVALSWTVILVKGK